MKILFLGTPEFSSIVLQHLIQSKHQVVGVVTKLDKQVGRGQKLSFSCVKQLALKNNIPVFQFKSISKEGEDVLKPLGADVLVTAAFGQILRQNIIDLAPRGVLNVHGSLLPKYRGSSPVQYAILNGETLTGVTIMQTDIGVDTGDMYLKKQIEIGKDETSGELMIKLANLGATALLEVLDMLENGTAKREKQNDEQATWFPMISKESGKLDFNKTATQIQNACRAFNPWPVCYVMLNGEDKLKVFRAQKIDIEIPTDAQNGDVIVSNGKQGLIVKCADGAVLLENIQAPNSKRMLSAEYLRGKKIPVGFKF